MFQQPEFKDLLFADINKYIKERNNKWFKQTGVNRARNLKAFIEKIMLNQEQLTTIQLMWRLYSYATMDMGDGPLGTSKDLRVIILDRMRKSLGVKKEDINSKLSERLDTAIDYAVATGGRTAYYVDDDKIKVEVRAETIRPALVSKSSVPVENVSEDFKNLMLDTIQKYINSIQASGWFTRWLSSTGLERAEKLKLYINGQLVGKEKLNDSQLFARMLEMTSMFLGEGMLGTSRVLRNELLKVMCSWNKLHLNQDAINKAIDARCEPVLHPNVTVGGGGYISVPDYMQESIQYRKEVLLGAKNKLFLEQLQQVTGPKRVAL
jgi:hypothetical protein